MVPVVFQIEFHGTKGLFELTSGYSAYAYEREVLVQDGLAYRVLANTEEKDSQSNKPYRLIKLLYQG